jgi:hypothetical protein
MQNQGGLQIFGKTWQTLSKLSLTAAEIDTLNKTLPTVQAIRIFTDFKWITKEQKLQLQNYAIGKDLFKEKSSMTS